MKCSVCYSCQNIRVRYFDISVQCWSADLHDSRDARAAGWLDHIVRDGVRYLLLVDRRTAGRQLLGWDGDREQRVRMDGPEDFRDAVAARCDSQSLPADPE